MTLSQPNKTNRRSGGFDGVKRGSGGRSGSNTIVGGIQTQPKMTSHSKSERNAGGSSLSALTKSTITPTPNPTIQKQSISPAKHSHTIPISSARPTENQDPHATSMDSDSVTAPDTATTTTHTVSGKKAHSIPDRSTHPSSYLESSTSHSFSTRSNMSSTHHNLTRRTQSHQHQQIPIHQTQPSKNHQRHQLTPQIPLSSVASTSQHPHFDNHLVVHPPPQQPLHYPQPPQEPYSQTMPGYFNLYFYNYQPDMYHHLSQNPSLSLNPSNGHNVVSNPAGSLECEVQPGLNISHSTPVSSSGQTSDNLPPSIVMVPPDFTTPPNLAHGNYPSHSYLTPSPTSSADSISTHPSSIPQVVTSNESLQQHYSPDCVPQTIPPMSFPSTNPTSYPYYNHYYPNTMPLVGKPSTSSLLPLMQMPSSTSIPPSTYIPAPKRALRFVDPDTKAFINIDDENTTTTKITTIDTMSDNNNQPTYSNQRINHRSTTTTTSIVSLTSDHDLSTRQPSSDLLLMEETKIAAKGFTIVPSEMPTAIPNHEGGDSSNEEDFDLALPIGKLSSLAKSEPSSTAVTPSQITKPALDPSVSSTVLIPTSISPETTVTQLSLPHSLLPSSTIATVETDQPLESTLLVDLSNDHSKPSSDPPLELTTPNLGDTADEVKSNPNPEVEQIEQITLSKSNHLHSTYKLVTPLIVEQQLYCGQPKQYEDDQVFSFESTITDFKIDPSQVVSPVITSLDMSTSDMEPIQLPANKSSLSKVGLVVLTPGVEIDTKSITPHTAEELGNRTEYIASVGPIELMASDHSLKKQDDGKNLSNITPQPSSDDQHLSITTTKLGDTDDPITASSLSDVAHSAKVELLKSSAASSLPSPPAIPNKQSLDHTVSPPSKKNHPSIIYPPDTWSPSNPTGKKIYNRQFIMQFQNYCLASEGISIPEEITNSLQLASLLSSNSSFGTPRFNDKLGSTGSSSSTNSFRNFSSSRSSNDRPFSLSNSGNSSGGNSMSSNVNKDRNIADIGSMAGSRHRGNRGDSRNNPRDSSFKNRNNPSPLVDHHHSSSTGPTFPIRDHSNRVPFGPITESEFLEQHARFFRGILNKIAPETFEILTEKLCDNQVTTIGSLVKLVDITIDKALSESKFSSLYARLCKALNSQLLPLKNHLGEEQTFRVSIMNKCQTEFCDRKPPMVIPDNITDPEELMELEEIKQKQHDKNMGLIRFIGELFNEGVIKGPSIKFCLTSLIEDPTENNLEQLCLLMCTIGAKYSLCQDTNVLDMCLIEAKKIVNNVSKYKISSRIRCLLQDMIDLQANNWQLKGAAATVLVPMKISEVHKDLERREREKEHQLRLMESSDKRHSSNSFSKSNRSGHHSTQHNWSGSNMNSANSGPNNSTTSSSKYNSGVGRGICKAQTNNVPAKQPSAFSSPQPYPSLSSTVKSSQTSSTSSPANVHTYASAMGRGSHSSNYLYSSRVNSFSPLASQSSDVNPLKTSQSNQRNNLPDPSIQNMNSTSQLRQLNSTTPFPSSNSMPELTSVSSPASLSPPDDQLSITIREAIEDYLYTNLFEDIIAFLPQVPLSKHAYFVTELLAKTLDRSKEADCSQTATILVHLSKIEHSTATSNDNHLSGVFVGLSIFFQTQLLDIKVDVPKVEILLAKILAFFLLAASPQSFTISKLINLTLPLKSSSPSTTKLLFDFFGVFWQVLYEQNSDQARSLLSNKEFIIYDWTPNPVNFIQSFNLSELFSLDEILLDSASESAILDYLTFSNSNLTELPLRKILQMIFKQFDPNNVPLILAKYKHLLQHVLQDKPEHSKLVQSTLNKRRHKEIIGDCLNWLSQNNLFSSPNASPTSLTPLTNTGSSKKYNNHFNEDRSATIHNATASNRNVTGIIPKHKHTGKAS